MEKTTHTNYSKKNTTSNLSAYEYEQKQWQSNTKLLGIDEAGRGSLFGPLVVSGVILPLHTTSSFLQDSKKMTEKKREQAYQWIMHHAQVNIRVIHARQVEQYNVYQATKKAMLSIAMQAYAQHTIPLVLTDAMPFPEDLPWRTISLIKGEDRSASIAAASIIAKVTRDHILKRMSSDFPAFNMHTHKGYGTAKHTAAILKHKATVLHRTTFIKKIKQNNET